jgi:xylulokinase
MTCFVGHDLGTGANKAVLARADGHVLASARAGYPLHHPRPGWAEQDPADWWRAVCSCTRELLERARVDASEVAGLCFAGQMLALAPLARDATPTRPAISWMDGRAEEQARRIARRFGGEALVRAVAGAAPTGKDVVAKIAWIRDEEPDVMRATAAFCDATGYLVARATGLLLADHTAAAGTGMTSRRTRDWSRALAAIGGLPLDKMPPVRRCVDVAGPLTADAARDLGLAPGTPVAVGMADIPAAAVGSGALEHGDAHVYLGTSAWLGVAVARPKHVPRAGIVSVASADPDMFLLIGESETAGACADWIARTLGLSAAEPASLDDLASRSEPGARGALFAPWMFGERSPVPDSSVRAAFVNLSLEHRREDLARAVLEGVAYNLAWILDAAGVAGVACPSLRAIGGGARSDLWLQTLADVAGRPVSRVSHPQDAGAIGAALMAAVALRRLPSVRAVKGVVALERTFEPRADFAEPHRARAAVLRELHPSLSRASRRLGGARTGAGA